MSLQSRLFAAIAAALLAALLLGGTLLCWHARLAVRDELATAFQGAQNEVRDTLRGDVQHTVTMRQVIAGFNGQRHIRAALLNEAGRVIVASRTAAPLEPAPGWFAALVAPPILTARIPLALPHYPCTLLLKSDPGNEAREVWDYARDAFATMVLFCVATLLLAGLLLGRTLRFLPRLMAALGAVSEGGYRTRLPPEGPPEFAALARGFNHMAARLDHYRQANQRLQGQLRNMQEEERAEIARDLHDEVGPYLFAIRVDADSLARGDGEVRERAGAIREAVLHVQQHVKAILRQLRPVNNLDFGLETAVDEVIGFWRHRLPQIDFARRIDDGLALDRRCQETIHRLVQESVSNAVRHGSPRHVRIAVTGAGDRVQVTVEDDGVGLSHGPDPDGMGPDGMGLAGMAERVRALHGAFFLEPRDGKGLRVRALLPRRAEQLAELA